MLRHCSWRIYCACIYFLPKKFFQWKTKKRKGNKNITKQNIKEITLISC